MTGRNHSQGLFGRMGAGWTRFRRDRRANVAVIFALALAPLCGVMGLAAEGTNWFLNNRAQQNAADSAVVGAANQALQDFYQACGGGGCNWSSTHYQNEGQAVAKQYGYTTGTGNVTVAVATVSCPGNVSVSGLDCFQVTITKPQQLYLTQVLGFRGNVTIGGARMQNIIASAIAGPVAEPADVCLLTLGQGGGIKKNTSFTFHGSHGINLSGCPVGSDDNMDCTGTNLQAPWGISGNGDTDGGCGNLQLSQPGPITDPYAALASDIPVNTCGSSYPGASTISTGLGSPTSAATIMVCGNLKLSSDLAITGDETVVIENGVLDLNGHNLTTSGTGGNGGVTVVFTSPNKGSLPTSVTGGSNGYIQDSAGGGGISISAPPAGSGNFAGVTLYQDPTPWGTGSSAKTYNSTWDGNSSKTGWDLSGGVYFPNADFTFNGAVDKAGNGYACFDMVANSITDNGGNQFSVFATDMSNPLAECGLEGTTTPSAAGYRYALVS
jgi:Flp pilus assembly protein TadG